MLKERKEGQTWIEPFVGSAGVISKVGGKRIGNDRNEYLIALLKAVQSGWIPPTDMSRETYFDIKNHKEQYPPELVGFAGFACSFGGKWFGGYIRKNKDGSIKYIQIGSVSLCKQAPGLLGIEFVCSDYLDMEIPPKSLIYCDPPYRSTLRYKDTIDYDVFYKWCKDRKKEGHTVFISEYNMPDDFECVLSIEYKTVMNQNKPSKRIEKLYRC
jgi:DNA adenine methylase